MSNGPLESKNYKISLNDAAAMTENFRDSNPNAKRGGAFPKKEIEDVIDQTGCYGIRYYFAEDDHGVLFLVIVGFDEDGNDMTGGEILERAWPCPPVCGEANALNGLET